MKRVAIWSAAGAGAALAALNLAEVAMGEERPGWLPLLDLTADLAVLGAAVFLAVRLALRTDAARVALGDAQARLEAVVDSAMDAILTVDREQRIVLFNRAAEAMFRCRREEALGAPLDRFIPARFRAAHRAHVEEFGRTGVTRRMMGAGPQLWALRSDGTEFPIEASISQTGEGAEKYYTVIVRDVTRRREFEDRLRRQQAELRELSARVLEAREEEKALLARELHDELGQLLTTLKLDLAWLRERVAEAEPALDDRLAQMSALVDRTVASVRRISSGLRPLILDDLGLADAVNWLAEDFASHSGVRVEVDVALDGVGEVPRPVANTLYRVLQESLTNIARHAQASGAWVALREHGGMLHLEVEDDGCGIDPQALEHSRSLGIKGMRERVLYMGGTVEIGRAPRGGTRVLARVPVRPSAEAAR
jgi:PAS domain S-box-containing protein